MKKLTFHEEADAEVFEATLYYEERSFGLGGAFLDAIGDAVELIRTTPKAYQTVGGEVRQKTLERFPYSLLYVIEVNLIRVVAVAHQKRRPGYWRSRVSP